MAEWIGSDLSPLEANFRGKGSTERDGVSANGHGVVADLRIWEDLRPLLPSPGQSVAFAASAVPDPKLANSTQCTYERGEGLGPDLIGV